MACCHGYTQRNVTRSYALGAISCLPPARQAPCHVHFPSVSRAFFSFRIRGVQSFKTLIPSCNAKPNDDTDDAESLAQWYDTRCRARCHDDENKCFCFCSFSVRTPRFSVIRTIKPPNTPTERSGGHNAVFATHGVVTAATEAKALCFYQMTRRARPPTCAAQVSRPSATSRRASR